MELNRNHYLVIGLVILFFGVQFRKIEAFVLTEKASRFLEEHARSSDESAGIRPFLASIGPTPRRTIRPPEWLGWSCISIGSVLVLHSLAMRKPGG